MRIPRRHSNITHTAVAPVDPREELRASKKKIRTFNITGVGIFVVVAAAAIALKVTETAENA